MSPATPKADEEIQTDEHPAYVPPDAVGGSDGTASEGTAADGAAVDAADSDDAAEELKTDPGVPEAEPTSPATRTRSDSKTEEFEAIKE